MSMPQPPVDEIAQRRRRAARTAMVVGGIAIAIYIAFIASGVVAA